MYSLAHQSTILLSFINNKSEKFNLTSKKMENQIENALLDLKELLGKGMFLEAMEKYLDDDVVLQEANNEPKVGKEVCLQAERELLADVTEFIQYDIKHYAIRGTTSYY